MSLLAGLTTTGAIEEQGDSVGGRQVLDSGLYKMTVKTAYLNKSSGGALALNLQFEGDKKQYLNSTIYITSGDKKGNKHTYTDKNGEDHYLPGFSLGNSLAQLTLGKDLATLDDEEKVVNIWNFDANAEKPTKVNMVTDLLGQKVIVGVQKQTVNKRAKQGDGSYAPIAETRDENEIDKLFRISDNLTTTEINAGATEATFIKVWSDKWTGVTRDRTEPVSGVAPTPGAPAAGTTKSLFKD